VRKGYQHSAMHGAHRMVIWHRWTSRVCISVCV